MALFLRGSGNPRPTMDVAPHEARSSLFPSCFTPPAVLSLLSFLWAVAMALDSHANAQAQTRHALAPPATRYFWQIATPRPTTVLASPGPRNTPAPPPTIPPPPPSPHMTDTPEPEPTAPPPPTSPPRQTPEPSPPATAPPPPPSPPSPPASSPPTLLTDTPVPQPTSPATVRPLTSTPVPTLPSSPPLPTFPTFPTFPTSTQRPALPPSVTPLRPSPAPRANSTATTATRPVVFPSATKSPAPTSTRLPPSRLPGTRVPAPTTARPPEARLTVPPEPTHSPAPVSEATPFPFPPASPLPQPLGPTPLSVIPATATTGGAPDVLLTPGSGGTATSPATSTPLATPLPQRATVDIVSSADTNGNDGPDAGEALTGLRVVVLLERTNGVIRRAITDRNGHAHVEWDWSGRAIVALPDIGWSSVIASSDMANLEGKKGSVWTRGDGGSLYLRVLVKPIRLPALIP